MLTCVPLGFFSWDYRVIGGRDEAILSFSWLTEQGTIQQNGTEYRVVKHGWASGHWTLEGPSGLIANAQKLSAMARTMEITAESLRVTARPRLMSRQFTLESEGREVGWIAPMHFFTRRAQVNCTPEVPELVQLFAFWLVALMWKRSNDSSAASTQ